MRIVILLIFGLILTFCACKEDKTAAPSGDMSFSLLPASSTGIDFSNDLIDDPMDDDRNVLSFYNYFNGGGVAIADLDNDGLEDLVFTGNEVENRIYKNKGDFKFEDKTSLSGINVKKKWTTGVTIVDINNDGWQDIYLCQSSQLNKQPGLRKNLLFINNRDFTFTEKAEEYGLADTGLSEQALFFDMDRDGDLDCYIVNNSVFVRMPLNKVEEALKNENILKANSSNMYRNDNGKFVMITQEAGMLRQGFGLSGIVTDINNDGWLDIYETNDYSVPDFMYINQKDGTFKDEINERTKQLSWFSMGADIADFDNDGTVDIAVVDMSATDHVRGKTLMAAMDPNLFYYTLSKGYQRQHMFNTMQVNNGDGTFNNIAGVSHLLSSEWSWAALLCDFDNDGWKDYFVANGFRRYARDNDSRIRMAEARNKHKGKVPMSMRRELYDAIPQVKIPNYIYKNKDGFTFEEKGKAWGTDQASYSNGAAYGDLDNDGDLDLVVNNIDEKAFVYKNNASGNYLDIVLESNSPKEGTKVIIEYGDSQQMLEYGFVRGFQSSNSSKLHFGLGDLGSVDRLKVIWPDGSLYTQSDVKANQILKINKNSAKQKYNPAPAANNLVSNIKNRLFTHVENNFNDYEKEVLLPYKQSTLGPFISKGDVNGDNIEDFFVGGAKGQSGDVFLQTVDGKFTPTKQSSLQQHSGSEDMGSHFFDADGDGDLDLYVISAGNDFHQDDNNLQDRIYLNDGKGGFSYAKQSLPPMKHGGSRVKSADIDGDGDLDLFIGGRLIPGNYPISPRSYLLENENGVFKDVTATWSEELLNPGLINDFVWEDFNGDDKKDLIIVGEWMPISFFENTGSTFNNVSSAMLGKEQKGWWYRILPEDLDGDGDTDFVVGNLGLNSKFHASEKKEFKVYANDFDGNGMCDVVLAKEYNGKTVPVRGRECSSEQMPYILDKFKTYNDFAQASVEDILGEDLIKDGVSLSVNNFESGILINENGNFSFKALPLKAQFSPIMGIVSEDVNGDGKQDLILAGNIYNMEIETPRLDASDGLILINKGNMEFTPKTYPTTGFKASGDAKDLALLNGGESKILVVANNNGPLELFKFN